MKIKSLYIEQLKALKDFKIEFNENVNILIGENGLGKTTILEIIYNMMISNEKFILEEKKCGVCELEVVSDEERVPDTFLDQNRISSKNIEEIIIKPQSHKFPDTLFEKKISKHWYGEGTNIVYLPTGVNFKKYKVETPKKIKQNVNIGIILNSDEMSINLKEYLVNIHYKDLEDISIGETPHRVEKFKKLYNSFFEEKEFIGIKDFEPLFKIKATGEMHSADELSAGEKQIFFRGGSLLQMNLNNSIILIDEPELSLHPEWQQKILEFYKGIGENNQIIIATHSPHIVSSCKREEVIVLGRSKGNTVVKSDVEETYGFIEKI